MTTAIYFFIINGVNIWERISDQRKTLWNPLGPEKEIHEQEDDFFLVDKQYHHIIVCGHNEEVQQTNTFKSWGKKNREHPHLSAAANYHRQNHWEGKFQLFKIMNMMCSVWFLWSYVKITCCLSVNMTGTVCTCPMDSNLYVSRSDWSDFHV